jgi:hypothetical protein
MPLKRASGTTLQTSFPFRQAIANDLSALWAFNVDARGNYGIDNLLIAENTDPLGKIVLVSQTLKREKGDALLLLVD